MTKALTTLRRPCTIIMTTILKLTLLTTAANAFSFSFTSSLTQCSQVTAQWVGGQPPFTLLLVPTGHLTPETRTIIQENIPSGNSVSFTLNYPAQSQFVAVLSDATGIGTGGTSLVTTVGSSSDSSCLNTQQVSPKFFLFQSPSTVSQCANIDLSVGSQAQAPIDILGIVPGGQSFEIANLTNGASSFTWQADVRSGTSLLFVAGDKDGLGSGGSSDVMTVGSGDSSCINSQSPSSTAGPAAGGVSTAASGGQTSGSGGGGQTTGGGLSQGSSTQTQTAGSNAPNPTGSNNGGSSSPSATVSNGSPGSSAGTGSAGNTVGNGGTGTAGGGGGGGASGTGESGPGQTGSGGQNDPGSPNIPGSGGGTVTGFPGTSATSKKHSNVGLIVGVVVAALALLGLVVGGLLLYRRRSRRARGYNNLEHNAFLGNNGQAPAFSQVAPHLRGGAGSSTDTLHSMFQTDPFILPAAAAAMGGEPEYNPYAEHEGEHERAPLTQYAAAVARPSIAARASSSRHSGWRGDSVPGGALAGAGLYHGRDRKESIGPHGAPPSRTPSGRTIPARGHGLPPPISTEPPTRVARDSEDFSPISPDDAADFGSADPFADDDEAVDIPPTYHSVQAVTASRQNSVMSSVTRIAGSAETEGGHDASWVSPSPVTRSLSRSNAISQSRRTRRSTGSFQGFRSDSGGHVG